MPEQVATQVFHQNGMFIDGEFIQSGSGGKIDHFDPATGLINGSVTLGGPADIDAAVQAAIAGRRVWEALGPLARRDILGRLADVVEAWEPDFRSLVAAEMGMPSRGFSERHKFAVEWIRTYQGWADKVGGDITATNDAGRMEYTRREAYGVVGIILTWNSPLLSLAMKIPAALAAGNAVVVKPSELTPYTAMLFAKACHEAGIPPGVVNIVPGAIEAGEALIMHPEVEKISFTGGLKAASAMMRTGAPLVKAFCFELGGKSAHLVFEDADLDLAVKVAIGGLANAGQSCTFGSRIFVQDAVYPAYRAKLVAALEAVVLGDPAHEATTMGPLVTAAARDRVVSFISDVVSKGQGTLLSGGAMPQLCGNLCGGYFVSPALFEDAPADSPLMREEIFGPVLTIGRFGLEEEGVRLANDTDLGLSNYVHTNDLRRALRVSAQLKSGTVYVNDASRRNAGAPFGGYKRSGIGYEGGRAGLDEYLRLKTIGLA